jgi:hypothetical protein
MAEARLSEKRKTITILIQFFPFLKCVYIFGTLCTVEPRTTNASHHEQIGSRTNLPKKKVSGDERCLELRTLKSATTVGDKLGVSAEERQLLCNFRLVHIVSVCEYFE